MKSKYLNIIITFLFLAVCSITSFSQSKFQPSVVNEKFLEANSLYKLLSLDQKKELSKTLDGLKDKSSSFQFWLGEGK